MSHTCPNCTYNLDNHLTPKEKETLGYMLAGLSLVEVAANLFRSPKTICTYWYRIKKKLGVENIIGVYRKWMTLRMIEVPDMSESPEYRAGYSQALADALSPDLSIFV